MLALNCNRPLVTRVGKGPTALYHAEWGPKYPKVPPGYLLDGPNPPTAVFSAQNLITIGALHALRERGRQLSRRGRP